MDSKTFKLYRIGSERKKKCRRLILCKFSNRKPKKNWRNFLSEISIDFSERSGAIDTGDDDDDCIAQRFCRLNMIHLKFNSFDCAD